MFCKRLKLTRRILLICESNKLILIEVTYGIQPSHNNCQELLLHDCIYILKVNQVTKTKLCVTLILFKSTSRGGLGIISRPGKILCQDRYCFLAVFPVEKRGVAGRKFLMGVWECVCMCVHEEINRETNTQKQESAKKFSKK